MPHPAMELQAHIYATLFQDVQLLSELGGNKIYDYVPYNTKPPYVAIGTITMNDWSTATEDGFKHQVTLHIWSDSSSRSKCYRIQDMVHGIINNLSPNFSNKIIVNTTLESCEIDRDYNSRYFHAESHFQILTEVT